MNEKEALEYINRYQQNPPQPTIGYYQDSYRDGYQNASGYFVRYPPMDQKLIDAILERDKNCRPYDPEKDSTEIKDVKFCDELAKRFTDLMKRAGNSAVDEYRKKNSHLYSMITEYKNEKITIIPPKLTTECEFKEECEKVCHSLGLTNYSIYRHTNENDNEGKKELTCCPLEKRHCMSCTCENAIHNVLSFCEYFKFYANEQHSENLELITSLCNDTEKCLENLLKLAKADYLQRIKDYVEKRK